MTVVGRFCPVFVLASSLLIFGCNQPGPAGPPASQANHGADHDDDQDHAGEHEHHESYAEAVKELDGLRLAARDAMANNNLEAADEAVHEIGHILEELPALAAKETAAPTTRSSRRSTNCSSVSIKLIKNSKGASAKPTTKWPSPSKWPWPRCDPK